MIKRLFIPVCLIALFFVAAGTARADDPPGAKLYATYCGACHGAAGKGGFAPAIGSAEYLTAKDDASIAKITSEGKTGGGMPAWGKSNGGLLGDDQITNIVAYLRSLAPGAPTAPAPAATVEAPAPTLRVFIQTKMTMAVSTNAQGKPVVNVSLKGYDGTPVGGAAIAFSRPTMFGAVDLGSAKTDAAGNASFVLDGLPREARQVVANFKGEKDWDVSDAKIDVEMPLIASGQDVKTRNVRLGVEEPLLDPDGSLITPNPPLVPATLFLVVVGLIWSIYVYVLSQIYGILKEGKQRPQPQNKRRFGV